MAHAESSTVSTSLFPNKCLIALYKVLSGRLQVMTAANQICLLILGLNHFAISQNKLRDDPRNHSVVCFWVFLASYFANQLDQYREHSVQKRHDRCGTVGGVKHLPLQDSVYSVTISDDIVLSFSANQHT